MHGTRVPACRTNLCFGRRAASRTELATTDTASNPALRQTTSPTVEVSPIAIEIPAQRQTPRAGFHRASRRLPQRFASGGRLVILHPPIRRAIDPRWIEPDLKQVLTWRSPPTRRWTPKTSARDCRMVDRAPTLRPIRLPDNGISVSGALLLRAHGHHWHRRLRRFRLGSLRWVERLERPAEVVRFVAPAGVKHE
jgi:hypothetical protein